MIKACLLGLLLAMLAAGSVRAQTPTGTLAGIVTDATGATVVGARVAGVGTTEAPGARVFGFNNDNWHENYGPCQRTCATFSISPASSSCRGGFRLASAFRRTARLRSRRSSETPTSTATGR
jgi:hypothetical protein